MGRTSQWSLTAARAELGEVLLPSVAAPGRTDLGVTDDDGDRLGVRAASVSVTEKKSCEEA